MREPNQAHSDESDEDDKFISKLVDHNVDEPVDQFDTDNIIDGVALQESEYLADSLSANNFMKSSLTMNDTLHSRIIDALAKIANLLDEEVNERIPDNKNIYQETPPPIIHHTMSEKPIPTTEEGYSSMEKWFLVTMGLFFMVLIMIILNILIVYRAKIFQSCMVSHEIERQSECDTMQHRQSMIQTHVFHYPFLSRGDTAINMPTAQ